MQVAEEKDFVARESRVRHVAIKAATAGSVLATSLLFFLILPVFPWGLMVLFAVGFAILAYKYPTPGVMLMLVLALPGYLYQLSSTLPPGSSLPAPLFVIMSFLLLGGAVVACQTGSALGVTTGAMAAILVLTPIHFLALPILIGILLVRPKNMPVHATSAVLTFAIFYFPLLAINSGTSAGAVPLFDPVALATRPPISILGTHEISSALGKVMDTAGAGGARTYLANLGDYWPLSFGQRLLPVGFVFCLLAGGGIAITRGMFALFAWLKKRDVNHDFLTYVAPAFSLMIAVLAFFLLAGVLAGPFDYANTINLPLLLGGTVLVGGAGSLAEAWLRKRDRTIERRDHLVERSKAIRTETSFLADRIRETRALCRRMDLSAEEALVQICRQELEFAEQLLPEISLTDLEQKIVRFEQLQARLKESAQESKGRLCQYYDEDRQRYNDSLTLAKKYGFDLGKTLEGPRFSQLPAIEYTDLLKLEAELNECYNNSARLLAEGVNRLEERLCTEIDPEFKRAGVRIAGDYLAQGQCAEAIQEFLVELGDIEHTLGETTSGLERDVASISNSLKTILSDILLPTATNLGDKTSVQYFREVTGKIADLENPPVENPTLPEIMRTASGAIQIGEIMAELSSKLGDKLSELSKSIQGKAPRGYDWGVDPQVQNRLVEVSRTFKGISSPMDIRKRTAVAKGGPGLIEAAAHSIKAYFIAHELLINFANVESIIEKTLEERGFVSYDSLPVKREYAHKYLELYSLKYPQKTLIEADTGRLTKAGGAQIGIRAKSNNPSKSLSH